MSKVWFDLELLGDKKLIRDIEKFNRKFQRRSIVRAMREAGRPILSKAKENARNIKETGTLEASMKLRAIKSKKARRRGVFGVNIISVPEIIKKNAKSEKDWYYSAFVELGTAKTKPRPLLREALNSNRGSAFTIIKATLRSELRRVT